MRAHLKIWNNLGSFSIKNEEKGAANGAATNTRSASLTNNLTVTEILFKLRCGKQPQCG